MKIEIKSWRDDSVLWAGEAETLKKAVERAVKDGASLRNAFLDGANLRNASLDGASLRNASLDGANLDGAILDGALLVGAILRNANLDGASLVGASLVGANLDGASLGGAFLGGASLDGAILDGATMPDGRPWALYSVDPLAGICEEPEARKRAIDAWGNHQWSNCPMHAAYGWNSIGEAPSEKRRNVAVFVALFDSKLLMPPAIGDVA